jgi:hypothetical protein
MVKGMPLSICCIPKTKRVATKELPLNFAFKLFFDVIRDVQPTSIVIETHDGSGFA